MNQQSSILMLMKIFCSFWNKTKHTHAYAPEMGSFFYFCCLGVLPYSYVITLRSVSAISAFCHTHMLLLFHWSPLFRRFAILILLLSYLILIYIYCATTTIKTRIQYCIHYIRKSELNDCWLSWAPKQPMA